MRNQITKAILLLLLLWAVGTCLSVSASKDDVLQKNETKLSERFKEQLNQEEQNRSVAWSEPTSHPYTLTNATDKLPLTFLTSRTIFLLYKRLSPSPESYSIPLAFSALSKQFRIQPNAP